MRVAQLDRASDYGSEGREFESSRARIRKRPAEWDSFIRNLFGRSFFLEHKRSLCPFLYRCRINMFLDD